jgi:hypothetical protein
MILHYEIEAGISIGEGNAISNFDFESAVGRDYVSKLILLPKRA